MGKREVDRLKETGCPLSLAVFEIIQFSEISQKYGYKVSDTLMRALVDGCNTNPRS